MAIRLSVTNLLTRVPARPCAHRWPGSPATSRSHARKSICSELCGSGRTFRSFHAFAFRRPSLDSSNSLQNFCAVFKHRPEFPQLSADPRQSRANSASRSSTIWRATFRASRNEALDLGGVQTATLRPPMARRLLERGALWPSAAPSPCRHELCLPQRSKIVSQKGSAALGAPTPAKASPTRNVQPSTSA